MFVFSLVLSLSAGHFFLTALDMFQALDFIKVEYSSVILRTSEIARRREKKTHTDRMHTQMIYCCYPS